MKFLLRALSVVVLLTIPVHAKSLHWQRIDVTALLDCDGVLHVAERQAMVFDGDWNGGERRFTVPFGQELELEGVTRIDETSSKFAPRQSGHIAQVDHYEWSGNTLRWRSRLPSDPPFANKLIVYEINYSIRNVLVSRGDHYALDHEFAFAERDGVIERFTLTLKIDPSFKLLIETPLHWEVTNLLPGQTFGVRIPLAYHSSKRPAGISQGAPMLARASIATLLMAIPMILIAIFLRREKARGRFEALPSIDSIDAGWLEKNLFSMPAEVAGAAWDNTTGAPEVAGLLARLVQEAKLASRVEKKRGILKEDVLHLTLLVPREQLRDYEKTLVGALFFSGKTKVTTDEIGKHYKTSGFDPSAEIRGGVAKRVNRLLGTGRKSKEKVVLPIALLFAGAVVLISVGGLLDSANLAAMGILTAIFVASFVTALLLSFRFAKAMTSLTALFVAMLAPLAVSWTLLLALAAGIFEAGTPLTLRPLFSFYHPGSIFLAGMSLLFGGFLAIVLANARTQDSADRLEVRRRLAAAREYFRSQLRLPSPAILDEWYPYLIAFGLGVHVDRWFRSFGRKSYSTAGSISALGTADSGSGSGTSWTGGGGGFGGAGASGAWAAAAGSLAAGISAPSSGGGGGGGGFSSGGGGGGGW
ncbi:MAG: DUF2207 domain-containing protein [Acidobacteriota bacterium]